MSGKKQKRKSNLLLKIAILLCFLAGMGLLVWYCILEGTKKQEARVQESLRDLYYATATEETPRGTPIATEISVISESRETQVPTATPEPTATPKVMAEKFLKLYEVNPEVIGWVKAGDEIDGPVVYRDNSYYLHRDFYGNQSGHGTLFMDEENWHYDTDPYRILYGHQFDDGTMFSGLKRYKKLSYLQTFPLVEFHTLYEQEPGTYVIFSVFDASVSELDGEYIHLRCFDEYRGSMEFRESFLSELKERSWYDIPVEVNGEDQILCMVTCSYSDRNGRLMIFSRRLREGETADTFTTLMAEAVEK